MRLLTKALLPLEPPNWTKTLTPPSKTQHPFAPGGGLLVGTWMKALARQALHTCFSGHTRLTHPPGFPGYPDMEERKTLTTSPSKSATIKKKSIFTDIVHLAGLTDSNKSNGRDSVLDLRTKPSFQQSPNSERSSSIETSANNGLARKPSSSIASVLDRNHSFSAFASPSFFTGEPFSPLMPSPHAFHEFLPGAMLAAQSSGNGGVPLCWPPPAYTHAATSFLSPLSFRSQFPPLSYNLGMQLESAVNGEACFGHGQGQPQLPPGKVQSVASAVSRIKQAPRFQCPDCNRVYSTFSGLSKHRQFHCAAQLKRQFGCKFCQKHYTSLGALKMHIRTHTLPCKCELCGKAFSRPWLLQGHVRTHTGEKPFRCVHCGRAFADRSNLRAHLQTHSDVKKYRCVCCQKTFSRMSLLTKHESNGCPGVGHA